MRLLSSLSLVVISLLAVASPALAADGSSAPIFGDYGQLSVGIGIGLALIGAGLGLRNVGAAGLEGIGRNPGAAGAMFVPYIIGLAMIEGLAFFAVYSISTMAALH